MMLSLSGRPGGSIAAKTCAEGGLDVLLIERGRRSAILSGALKE